MGRRKEPKENDHDKSPSPGQRPDQPMNLIRKRVKKVKRSTTTQSGFFPPSPSYNYYYFLIVWLLLLRLLMTETTRHGSCKCVCVYVCRGVCRSKSSFSIETRMFFLLRFNTQEPQDSFSLSFSLSLSLRLCGSMPGQEGHYSYLLSVHGFDAPKRCWFVLTPNTENNFM